MLAAIDAHRRSGDEFAVFGDEEAHAAGDFAGLAEAADGNLGDDLLQHRFGHGGDHVGVDIAGRDGVDGDAEARAFLGQCLGEAVDTAFGGGVVDLAVLARLPVDRTDIHDPAPAAFLHPGEGRLGEVEAAAQIGAHYRIPIFVPHLQQRAVTRDPCIVDHDFDRAVFFLDLLAGFLHRVEIRYVEFDCRNAGFFGEFLGRIVIAGIIGGHSAVVELLTSCGAEIASHSEGLLGFAVRSGRVDLVKRLLENGADASKAPRAYQNRGEMFQLLKSYGVEPADVNDTGARGWPALVYASRGDKGEHPEKVQRHLDLGADVNIRNYKGKIKKT